VDLSALIFVALAAAWAVYLVPKALKHHDDVVRSRSVDRFSHTMRVLARREPVDKRRTRLVVSPGRAPAPPVVTTKARSAVPAAETRPEREAARRAARRRRRVLGTILLALVATAVVAGFGVISWWWVAAPATLLVAWLVACRLMVRSERNARFDSTIGRPDRPAEPEHGRAGAAEGAEAAEPVHDDLEDTSQTPAITDPSLWDPMPVTLPTYVNAPTASRRTVRTIDLDSTGVWTSGRTEADSALAREADEADRARRTHDERQQRATGS